MGSQGHDGGTCRIAAERLTLTGGVGPDAPLACRSMRPTSYSVRRDYVVAIMNEKRKGQAFLLAIRGVGSYDDYRDAFPKWEGWR